VSFDKIADKPRLGPSQCLTALMRAMSALLACWSLGEYKN